MLGGGIATGTYRDFASNTDLIIAVSFGAGVFYSKDDRNSWTAINTGLTDLTIFDLELNNEYIIAATDKGGIFRYALSNLK